MRYLIRATSPVTVYAISPAGEVVRQFVVRAPGIKASPLFGGVRVAKNRLVVQGAQACDSTSDSCRSTVYAVFDATTGKQLATYELAR